MAANTATRSCHVAQLRLPLICSCPGAGSASPSIGARPIDWDRGQVRSRVAAELTRLTLAGNSFAVKTVTSVFNLDAAHVPAACRLGNQDLIDRVGRRCSSRRPKCADNRRERGAAAAVNGHPACIGRGKECRYCGRCRHGERSRFVSVDQFDTKALAAASAAGLNAVGSATLVVVEGDVAFVRDEVVVVPPACAEAVPPPGRRWTYANPSALMAKMATTACTRLLRGGSSGCRRPARRHDPSAQQVEPIDRLRVR